MTYTEIKYGFCLAESGDLQLSVDGDAGEAVETLAAHELDQYLPLGHSRRDLLRGELDLPHHRQAPRDLGNRLLDLLRTGKLSSLLDGQLGRLRDNPSARLRLRLSFDPRHPELRRLEALPWELLHHPNWGHLALHRRFSLVRNLPVADAVPPALSKLPLRILAIPSSPADARKLDLDRERQHIDEALQGSLPEGKRANRFFELHVLESAEPDRIRSQVLAEPPQIIHFMGHGDRQPGRATGIMLESSEGRRLPYCGEAWVELISDVGPWLVVLNACDTGQAGFPHSTSHSLAQRLIHAGVPAVLAMRTAVSDAAAIELARHLYRRLAAGDHLEEALVEGRKAIHRLEARSGGSSLRPGAQEWSTPVLFLRGRSSQLFSENPTPGHSSAPVEAADSPWTLLAHAVLALAFLGTAFLGEQLVHGDRSSLVRIVAATFAGSFGSLLATGGWLRERSDGPRTAVAWLTRLTVGVALFLLVFFLWPPSDPGSHLIRITVRHMDGRLADDAEVEVRPVGEVQRTRSGWLAEIPTSVLPRDRQILILATHPQFPPAERRVQLDGQIHLGVELTLAAEYDSEVKGTVVDPEGRPIPGAEISAGGYGEGTVRTDRAGAFRLKTQVPPGESVQLQIIAPGYRPSHPFLLTNGAAVRVQVHPEPALGGS